MVTRQPDGKRAAKVPKGVGERMRTWRRSQGFSLEDVARELGTSKGHLSHAETGKGNLSLPLFIGYCEVIGVPASRILEQPILAKDRDFQRLSAELERTFGLHNLGDLAQLTKAEARLLIERGMEAVELARLRKRERGAKSRSHDKPSKGSVKRIR